MTQPTDPLGIVLEAQQWNVVLSGLGELPWRVADPIVREILKQAQQQPQPVADAPPALHKANGLQPHA